MAKYRLIESGVVNNETGAHIPPGHWMYHEYEAWVAAGNIPDPILPPPSPVAVCSRWQIRKALNQIGLRSAVEAAVAASTNQDVKDGWEFANEFRSDDPLVVAMGVTLGKTEAEVRGIIELGATL